MKAVVLLSGGIDSTVVLALAASKGRECLALSFDYGQRHRVELKAAQKIAAFYHVDHKIITIDKSTFGNSSLVDAGDIPKNRDLKAIETSGTPSTYVPARNTLFLAYALGQAEIIGAKEIYFGPNAYDQIPYPDCRPTFVQAFQQICNIATKQSDEGCPPEIMTPIIHMDKKGIIELGQKLGAPLEMTHSCYDPLTDGSPCHMCDACYLRESYM